MYNHLGIYVLFLPYLKLFFFFFKKNQQID